MKLSDSLLAQYQEALREEIREELRKKVTSLITGSLVGRECVTVSAPPASSGLGGCPKRRRPKPGAKRSSAELGRTRQAVLDFITGNPGSGAEQIKKGLRLELSDIQLPIAKLLKERSISKTGNKRATKYFTR